MAKMILSGPERLRIAAILRELDPDSHELLAPFKENLSAADWNFVVEYARAEMRGALEMGLLARGLADTARMRGMANADGISSFLESTSWMRNFGMSDESDEHFKRLADVDTPMFVAVDALLQMAQDRMFNTLDEEYARLLDASI